MSFPILLPVSIAGEHNIIHISNTSGTFDIIPQDTICGTTTKILINNEIIYAGNYYITAGKNVLTGISFNYNRKESDLTCYSTDELAGIIKKTGLHNFNFIIPDEENLTHSIEQMSQGIQLWKWLIVLALIFLTGEVVILRLWR
ncbi:MAG: hypothetical protein HY738_00235 [Bacteroidia bacterium]|nr:hypothetical protein [Bacteroidia bacterium]